MQLPFPLVDPRSIIVLAGIMGLVMSLVLYFLRRSCPPGVRGLREWMQAPLVCFSSTMLFATRDFAPQWISIVLANMVLFYAVTLYYAGSQLFLGGPRRTRGWTVATLAMGPAMAWFTYVHPSYDARLVIFTLGIAALFGTHARLYLRHGLRGFGMRFMLGVMLAQILVVLLRLASVAAGYAGSGLMEPGWIQSVYIGMYTLTALLLSVGAVVMTTDRVRTELQYIARHDPLTGVLNRGALMEAFDVSVEMARRHRQPLSVLLLDLDHFKAVNDSLGHQAGDRVLQDFTRGLQTLLRAPDTLGRYGGEEFVVVLPEADLSVALGVAERIRAGIQASSAAQAAQNTGVPAYTASIGVTELRRAGADTIDAMLARADAALYEAKHSGRNQVRFA